MTGPDLAGLEGRLGFVISVPDSWYEIELQPALRDDAIRRLVESRVRGNDEMWAQRHSIRKILTEQSERAWSAGATYCAAFTMPTEEGAVTGSLTVSIVPDLGDLAAEERFDTVARTADPYEPYATTSVVDIESVGSCVRSSGIEDADFMGGLLRHVFMVTVVPVPGDRRAFLLTASSPVVALADALLDLFDAVTGTFRLVRLDDDAPPAPQEA